ncbi:hypothetical protein GE21DRAFT_1278720 [Neurospora crassa]|nr:hypothetical protein GE21DRAFT_1278720 [Neurospora crassa]
MNVYHLFSKIHTEKVVIFIQLTAPPLIPGATPPPSPPLPSPSSQRISPLACLPVESGGGGLARLSATTMSRSGARTITSGVPGQPNDPQTPARHGDGPPLLFGQTPTNFDEESVDERKWRSYYTTDP